MGQDDKLKSSAELLQGLFKDGKSPLSQSFLQWRIWQEWPAIVGRTIAGVSEPVFFRKGILYVYVKNPSWLTQIHFLREQIRFKLNEKFGNEKLIEQVMMTANPGSIPQTEQERTELLKAMKTLGG